MSESESLEIVNFTNIADFEFTCGWGGHTEVFPAGKTVPLPMFKAVAFCKHLVDAILRKEGKDYSSDLMRAPLEDKIMGRVTVAAEVAEKVDKDSEEEFADAQVDAEKTPEEIKAEKKAAKDAEMAAKKAEKEVAKIAKAEAKAAEKAAKEAAKEA